MMYIVKDVDKFCEMLENKKLFEKTEPPNASGILIVSFYRFLTSDYYLVTNLNYDSLSEMKKYPQSEQYIVWQKGLDDYAVLMNFSPIVQDCLLDKKMAISVLFNINLLNEFFCSK